MSTIMTTTIISHTTQQEIFILKPEQPQLNSPAVQMRNTEGSIDTTLTAFHF